MFPPGSYGVALAVDPLEEPGFEEAFAEPWPSRLGELLPVWQMTDAQLVLHLQRLQGLKAELAAFEAELIDELAVHRPASADRQPGQVGAASGEWAAQLLDEEVSEFFPDELAAV